MEYCIVIVDKIIMIFCSHCASFFAPWLCLHRKIKGTNGRLVLFHLCSQNQQEETGLELSMSHSNRSWDYAKRSALEWGSCSRRSVSLELGELRDGSCGSHRRKEVSVRLSFFWLSHFGDSRMTNLCFTYSVATSLPSLSCWLIPFSLSSLEMSF